MKKILALSSPKLNDRSSLVERCVLVTKQADGYGLTVTGDHPVFVASVKPGGSV
jgi:Rho guanine nucleotide exchange factor 12